MRNGRDSKRCPSAAQRLMMVDESKSKKVRAQPRPRAGEGCSGGGLASEQDARSTASPLVPSSQTCLDAHGW